MPGPGFDCMTRMIDFIADDDQYNPGYYDDHGYDGDHGYDDGHGYDGDLGGTECGISLAFGKLSLKLISS